MTRFHGLLNAAPAALFAALALGGCLDIDAVRDRYADAGPICDDGELNGDETDIDCGGPTCDACTTTSRCSADSDCLTGFCRNGECAVSVCGDGIVRDDEDCDSSGIDTDECNADCTTASCSDGNTNQDETDVDCGGSCDACANGRACEGNDDCTSGSCVEFSCASATCGDTVVNSETEECDPGPASSASCDADCTAVQCRDGFFNAAAGEECDDGNDTSRDGCSTSCTIERNLTFGYTGAPEVYVVPPGVTSIQLTVLGAEGGPDQGGSVGNGGRGGEATGTLTVTPGDVLYIRVGERGGANTGAYNGGAATSGVISGGGASDVRLNGQSLGDRVIVAGGGGGGQNGTTGGSGGGLSGGNARVSSGLCNPAGLGTGASQTEGGEGGVNHQDSNERAEDGALGLGGNGSILGSGGGGGYYGGGGGYICGGGGGSSYVGGVSDGATRAGVRTGHGEVRLVVP